MSSYIRCTHLFPCSQQQETTRSSPPKSSVLLFTIRGLVLSEVGTKRNVPFHYQWLTCFEYMRGTWDSHVHSKMGKFQSCLMPNLTEKEIQPPHPPTPEPSPFLLLESTVRVILWS